MVKNVIVYILFLECCQHTNDVFWKSVFKDLAYGKPPYGTFISNHKLCCNYKGKEFIYKIESDKESKIVFNELHDIFNHTLGLFSNEETLLKKQKIESFHEIYTDNWANIKKNVKLTMLHQFCIDCSDIYCFSIQTAKQMLSIITIGFLFKTILPQHIHYSNNKINSIDGIQCHKHSFTYNEHLIKIKQNKQTIQQLKFENAYMSDFWNKFIQMIKQKSKGRKI